MTRQRVLIVDDEAGLRRLIRRVIERVPGFQVSGEAANGRIALQLAETDPPDIVLTDVDMPEMDGVELTRHLVDAYPDVRVVALTGAEPGKALSDMIMNGAVGYLVKTASIEEMIHALDAVRRGFAVLAPEATSLVLKDLVEHYRAEQQRAEALMALDAMKRNFMNVISHELKTPVTIIKGGIQILGRHAEELDPISRRAFLSSIEAQCLRLQRMIDQVLLVSQIDRNPTTLPTETVDLAAHLASLIAELPTGDGDRITMETVGAEVIGPPFISHIVAWMLDNALSFSSGDIRIRCATRTDGETHIEIVDEGVGMTDELVRRVLTEPFTQKDSSTTRPRDGLGLSLYAARQVLESLGGDLRVQSAPGVGTTVSLVLPDRPRTSPAGTGRVAASSS